jgi:hypothetical protein
MEITIKLTQDEFDSLINILMIEGRNHPDSAYIVNKLYQQLHFSPSDE